MKKSLKNKVFINISASFIAVMLIVTILLSIIMTRQNRKVAHSLFQNTFNMVRYTIDEKKRKLLLDSSQMTLQNDMSGMVNYVAMNQQYFNYSIMKPTYLKMTGCLYSTGLTAEIYHSAIYGMDHKLIAFCVIGEKESTVGYCHNEDAFEIAQVEPGMELTYEVWTPQQTLPAEIPSRFDNAIPKESHADFEIIDGSLCITAQTPVIGKDYNALTDKMEPKQVGILITIQKLDDAFVNAISELSGTQINIFNRDGLIVGTHPAYTGFKTNRSEKYSASVSTYSPEYDLNDIKIAKDSFYQAAMPICTGSKCIATIISLYSKQDANAYTAQIIKMMSAVYFVGLFLMAPVVIFMIMRSVIKPIEKMSVVIRNITQTKDFNQTLDIESQDEIGDLANTFNQMIEDLSRTTTSIDKLNKEIAERLQKEKELREIQEELIEASRRAGMAEVATDVLHNVGNVLNSVNVSATLITETLASSEIPNLRKVADMIEAHQQDLNTFFTHDAKGRCVPSYLIKATKLLVNEQQDVVAKLGSLTEDVNHIKSIIRMQQEYAKVAGVEVTTTVDDLVEDAIRINQAALGRHNIQLIRDYADLGNVSIDKQRVIQILVNLISNAKYALSENQNRPKILKIRSYRQDEKYLRIDVTDNGTGIPKENLTKIFRHGFTTKKNGHGFGLHSGSLAAKEMKGSLTAHSDGVGQGATFTLELPFKPAGVMQWT
jgi:signal transduction histidine kinase